MQKRPLQLTSIAIVIAMLNPSLAAVRGEHAEYVGGTIKTIKQGSQGMLSLDDKKNLLFDCGKASSLLIPYADIQSMEFGQKVGRRVGSTIALGVTTIGVMALPMLLSKKKNHFLTITFAHGQADTEVVVLELAKGIVRTTIPVLEARTGKRVELQDNEHGPVTASARHQPAGQPAGSPAAAPEEPRGAVPPPLAPPLPSVKPMTNQDVLALKMAAFSDEFLISKIKATPAAYKLDTDDILALKKSHLSEPVIQAMMAASSPAPAAPAPKPPAPEDSAADRNDPPRSPQAAELTPAAAPEPAGKGLLTRLKDVFSGSSEDRKPGKPQSVPAEPAAPSQFALTPVTVISKPAGAAIFVDGYPAGRTPAEVKLVPGKYKLTLKADGFPEYSQQITVEPGQIRSFGVALDGSK